MISNIEQTLLDRMLLDMMELRERLVKAMIINKLGVLADVHQEMDAFMARHRYLIFDIVDDALTLQKQKQEQEYLDFL